MDMLSAVKVFVRVVAAGSFSAVARESGVSHSAVTRQITQLEEHFGVRLLHRNTRRLSLTDDGQILIGHAEQLLQDAAAMETVLGQHSRSPGGHVRLAAPPGVAHVLAPGLGDLAAVHSGLSIELLVHEHFHNLVEARLDLAVLQGEIVDSSLMARRIGFSRKLVVAAPRYLQRNKMPQTPDELVQHRCIVLEDEADQRTCTSPGPPGPDGCGSPERLQPTASTSPC